MRMQGQIQELLAQVDFEAFYRSHLQKAKKSGKELRALCPFHPDKIQSFSTNIRNGLFKCFACSREGSIFQFIEELEKVSFVEAVKILAEFAGVTMDLNSKPKNDKRKNSRPPIDPSLPEKYHKILLKNEKAMSWLQEKRGYSLETIKRYQLGWTGSRYTIPIYDENATLRNIRLYSSTSKPKLLSWYDQGHGYGEGRIFGLDEMKTRPDETVFLMEGEVDKFLASQDGFLAVSGTVGAATWKPEWTEHFKGRHVVILYDVDSEGQRGADNAAWNLVEVAASVKIVELPLKGSKSEKDYTDYRLAGGSVEDVKKLVGKTPLYVLPPEEEKEQAEKKAKRKAFIPRVYADKVVEEFSLKYDVADYFYYYDKGDKIWKFNAEKFLAHWLEMWEGLPVKRKTQYQINEIINSAQRISRIMEIPQQPPINLIPFENCIVDFETGKKYEYGPEYFFINKLAIPYVPKEIKTPMIEKFLESIVAEEDVISIIELFGYAMVRSYPYQMSFWLYGGGGNGKTQACELGKRILGIENVSAVRLEAIDRGNFQTANLYGKLMNVSPEIDLQILKRTGIFKQLTGGDLIQFEKKYKDAFVGKNYAKMVFLCNFLPYSFDISPAFFRRIFLVEFVRMFREESDAISEIATKFPQEEVNAFGYGCFLALRELAKRDFRFSRHKAMEERREDYLKKSDPLQTFLDEETKRDYDGKVSSVDFNLKFSEYQKKVNVKTLWTSVKIRRVMRDKGYIPQTIRDEDQRYEGYRGFSWIDNY